MGLDIHFTRKKTTNDKMLTEEVAYFRKFWWLIHHFDYKEECCGQDVEITKEQIEELVTLSKKMILMVEKHFKDSGWEIERSPINCNTSDISFRNGLVTDKLIEEADDICAETLDSFDDLLFYKVCEIYTQFKRVLETTDLDSQKIYMSANW